VSGRSLKENLRSVRKRHSAFMYKKILVTVDNSVTSNYCIDHGIRLSKQHHSLVVGCHVYDAGLHQKRFRDMEKGLPARYQDESVLQRQRELHTSLINTGLRLISESYLDVFDKKCSDAAVLHEKLLLEGKNYCEIVKEVKSGGYDLVIIGAAGLAAVDKNVIGSVCERVVRRINTDVLVVKNDSLDGDMVVAVDGSNLSSAGVKYAIDFANSFNRKLTAVSVFDPHYHRVAFESIAKVLSKEAGQVFRFKEQETLHEEIIDRGLAKIYQNHLDNAASLAKNAGIGVDTVLLDGKPFDQILKFLEKKKPSLLIMGRTGIHNVHGLDIGSTSENLLRLAPCNILLVGGNSVSETKTELVNAELNSLRGNKTEGTVAGYEQPIRKLMSNKAEKRSNDGKTLKIVDPVTWTQEARSQTDRIPPFIKEVVRKKIEEYARGKGCREITSAIVNEAKAELMNGSMIHNS